jgi:predicted dehydrogenase
VTTIGVGIIGASTSGWAAASHVPALARSQAFDLRAVSTTRRESAEAAAAEFGATAAYDTHAGLINDPRVDLVVVAVKVPHHRDLITAALQAGKMVYSEWPLGNGSAEADALSRLAQAHGARTVIGLQARFAPSIRYARDLVAQGYLGRVLGTTLVGSGMVWGPTTDRSHAYWFDEANGATTLTVPTIHALDAFHYVLGEFRTVTAHLVRGRTRATLVEDGSTISVSAPDQVVVGGVLQDGAAASIYYRGGASRGENLRWEINGTDGDLVISSADGNLQVADLRLEGARAGEECVAAFEVPDEYY